MFTTVILTFTEKITTTTVPNLEDFVVLIVITTTIATVIIIIIVIMGDLTTIITFTVGGIVTKGILVEWLIIIGVRWIWLFRGGFFDRLLKQINGYLVLGCSIIGYGAKFLLFLLKLPVKIIKMISLWINIATDQFINPFIIINFLIFQGIYMQSLF